jgi:hypothetical protein
MRTPLIRLSLTALLGTVLLAACQSTTLGGATNSSRSQLLLVSSAEVNQGSALAYNQTVNKARSSGVLNTNKSYVKRANTISQRLIDAELSAVMGHEISHALREHSREQLSQEVVKQQGLSLVGVLAGLSGETMGLVNMASKYALTLPFSRTMESEADTMGLELMARAGYNPEAAVNVWRKMQQLDQRGSVELLSTHPSSATRIQDLQSHLPQVMPLYLAAAKGKNRSST